MFEFKTKYILFFFAAYFCWPATLFKQPLFFADTQAYFTAATVALEKTIKISSKEWKCHTRKYFESKESNNLTNKAVERPESKKEPVMKGRSIYYAIYLYLSSLIGSTWFTIFLQALLSSIIIFNILYLLNLSSKKIVFIFFLIGTLTSLPFFTSFLMPDFLAGLTIISGAGLGLAIKKKNKFAKLSFFILLILGGICHDSIIPLSIFIFLIWFIIGLKTKNQQAAIMCFYSILLSLSGSYAFDLACKKFYGTDPIRIPFLSSRLIELGVGSKWLIEHCDSGTRFSLCDFPQARNSFDTETNIWSQDPKKGIWRVQSIDNRIKISEQNLAFAKEVFLSYPILTTKKILSGIIDGALNFKLYDFIDPQYMPKTLYKCVKSDEDKKPSSLFSISFFSTLQFIFILTCFIVAAYTVFKITPLFLHQEKIIFLAISFAGYFANIIICSSIVGNYTRYTSRTLWILPFIFIIIIFEGFDEIMKKNK